MTRGIPTEVNGWRCRSRLEAQWATYFELLGWDYEFEPLDCKGWIPDFLIKGKEPLLLEVKPVCTVEECDAYMPKILAAEPPYPVAIVGCGLLAGKLSWTAQVGRFVVDSSLDIAEQISTNWCSDLSVVICEGCGDSMPSFSTESGGWWCIRCGHGEKFDFERGARAFNRIWREAAARVQWHPKGRS